MSTVFRRAQVIALLFLVTTVAAQELPKSQPPLWSAKPDVAAFEKMENDRLAAAQSAIDQIVSVKGSRTIENTLAPYDEAIRQPDPATRYYIQRQLLEFRLAGVDKDDATREKLKKLQNQLTEDQSRFDRNISDAPRVVEVTDAAELEGLPQDYIDNHRRGADGKIHITTNYPDLFPPLTFAKSDGLRRRLWEAFKSRAYPKNRDMLRDMARGRNSSRFERFKGARTDWTS